MKITRDGNVPRNRDRLKRKSTQATSTQVESTVIGNANADEVMLVASKSSGRHSTSRSGEVGFESWLCRVDPESLGKALYMPLLSPLMCKRLKRVSGCRQ